MTIGDVVSSLGGSEMNQEFLKKRIEQIVEEHKQQVGTAAGTPFHVIVQMLTVTDFGGDAVFAGFHEAPRFRCRSRNSLWPSKLSAPIFRQPTSVQQSLLPFPRP